MSNRLVVSPDRVRVPRGARRPAAGVELRGLPRAWRCDRHAGTARRHSTPVRTPAQHNAQEVGVGVCSTNTGGTSAPGWYFIRLARSAPRMSPLEW